jgi:DNA-binding NarL/FixJ family response regulator
VRAILDLEPDIEIVAECRSPAEAIPVVAETCPDVVLVDVRLDEPSVAAATRRLTQGARGSAIVVVGGADDGTSILEAIAVGAAAHVAEVAEPGELVALIRRVADGKDPLKESLIARPDLVEQMVDAVRDGFIGPDSRSTMSVTPRELDVLRQLASGLRNREIADRLGVSEQTVKNHLSKVLHKLGVSNRIQAVTYAVRRGWLLLDPVAGSAEPMRSRAQAEDNSRARLDSRRSPTHPLGPATPRQVSLSDVSGYPNEAADDGRARTSKAGGMRPRPPGDGPLFPTRRS